MQDSASGTGRRVALVTGASRRSGIGAAVALELAARGYDVGLTYWTPYDDRMPWGSRRDDLEETVGEVRALGVRCAEVEADLEQVPAPAQVFDHIETVLGPVRVLVLAHCESVASTIQDTTVESFDRHYAVNIRATWLLIREFGSRFAGPAVGGRIVALTSDHTAGNVPYGATKGALDRIVLAAAQEFGPQAITANVVNPGGTDTGWMTEAQRRILADRTPAKRLGTALDCARLVGFLCSDEGQWVNGQVLHSNGGVS
jgi:3-oxoacyl-[acyl-carrier protein] reductase